VSEWHLAQAIDPHSHQTDKPEQHKDETDVDNVDAATIEASASPGVKGERRDLKPT
jgi:hypothetical protein